MPTARVLLGGAMLLAACRYHPAVVPLAGVQSELQQLAGDWEGEYTSDDTRRAGHIMFRIAAHGDSAYGDVMMFIPGYNKFPLPWDQPDVHLQHARSPEYLAIRFVAIEDGQVRGDEMRGRYLSKGDATAERIGRWQMKRARR